MDQSNNVHLRWNKHQATLVSVFDTLLGSEKLTDCTISAEGHHLRAHKIILSACSPYFEELFAENYEKHPIIILPDVKYDVVKALTDFMYRGEVNVLQEELSGFLKLSESLQIRGLCGSGCVDDVNMQKAIVRNAPPETLPSQPASVSCFTSDQNESEEKEQSFRACSPSVSHQEGGSVEVESISKSIQKYRKSINHSASDQRAGQNAFGEVITADHNSVHQLPSQRQVMPTTRNSAGGPVYSPTQALNTLLPGSHTTISTSSYSLTSHQSARSELQSSSGEMANAENQQFLIPEGVLPDKRSANLSAHQQKVSLETKSEIFVEDLTLDDDGDYPGDDDYCENSKRAEVDFGDGRRETESLTYEENIRTQEINNQHSAFGSDYLNKMTSTTSQTVLHNRFRCHSCGKSYQYPHGLQRHLKLECGKEPQVQCPRCDYRCYRRYTLKKHMTTRRCLMHKKFAPFDGYM